MGLKEFLKNRVERNNRMKSMIDDARLNHTVENRLKSPQERDVEEFIEKNRQAELKQVAKEIRQQETRSFWTSGLMDKSNMFKGHTPIMTAGSTFFDRGNML